MKGENNWRTSRQCKKPYAGLWNSFIKFNVSMDRCHEVTFPHKF